MSRRRVAQLFVLVLTACGQSAPPTAGPKEPPTKLVEAPPEDDVAPTIDDETADALEALGYFPSAPTDNPEERGVTIEAPDGATGLNLYSSRHAATAILMDMAGREVHRWEAAPSDERPKPWMHAEPLEGGDLLVITKGHHVSRVDWDSEVVWQADVPAHHDLAVHPDGRVFALIRWADHWSVDGEELPVLADGIAVLSPGGERLRRVPLLPIFGRDVSSSRWQRIRARIEERGTAGIVRGGGIGDVLHTNSIEILPRDIEGVAPEGSWLLSFRALDRVMILDAEMERILWRSPAGMTQGQHDATILPNDHFLIFDNGSRRGRSRVIELDPGSGEIVWEWGEDLYTQLRGGAQALENGNVVLTESDTGRALEVTRAGEVVWEFHNPEVHGASAAAERDTIYRLNRFAPSFFGEH